MLKEELDLVEARRKIIDFIKKEATESRTDGVVLALSGGIDSSVTAYLSVEALGARRVMGLIMPDLRVTPKQDLDDAKDVASKLGMETRFIDIARFIEHSRRTSSLTGLLKGTSERGSGWLCSALLPLEPVEQTRRGDWRQVGNLSWLFDEGRR